MHDAPLPDLVLYGRPECRLCDEAREMVLALLGQRRAAGLATPAFAERDIEEDEALNRAFFASIPVVELDDRRLELATSLVKIRRLLSDVLD